MSPTQAQSPADDRVGVDPRLIKALGHPLRQRILLVLGEGVASPSELSKQLGEPLGNVSYHVKILGECEAIELVRTMPVRGAVEHFYRATVRPHFNDEHWSKLPLATRRALFDNSLQEIWSHLVAAAEVGGLDDVQNHITWTNLELDREAYEAMAELLTGTLERAMDLHAESAARLAELSPDERESHRTELAMMHFHRAPGSPTSQVPPIGE
jgi:DNA-binding transcriptional ArsR family regulator